jgi:5-methylcytosine-specific restriction endonuclease McrA
MRHNDNFQVKEKFVQFYNDSKTIKQILIKMGLRPAGGNFEQVRKYCIIHGLSIPKLSNHERTKAASKKTTIPLEKILKKGYDYPSSRLKLLLINEGLLKNECNICRLKEWNNKPLTLHLHHIDGVHNNNELSNVRLLCPNCHSQTETYCNKKKSPSSSLGRSTKLNLYI